MKLDHEERPLRGARQEPAVEFGNSSVVRRTSSAAWFCDTATVLTLLARRSSKASKLIPAWWPSVLHDQLDGLDQRPRFWPTAKTLGHTSPWVASIWLRDGSMILSAEFELALRLNPNFSLAQGYYGLALAYWGAGRRPLSPRNALCV